MGYGEVGELVIGGVGLARYLDADKDAEKYAPMPTLGWTRAYRSGDLVRLETDGLYFRGRADDQVKVGGRRIELGEVDAALVHLPGVSGGAAAVRRTASGTPLLVGYLASADPAFDIAAARAALAERCPPRWCRGWCVVDELPTRTSGKVDRDALPWPPPGGRRRRTNPIWAARWAGWPGCGATCSARRSTGPRPTSSRSAAARWPPRSSWPRCAQRYPQVTVADLYDHPAAGLARRVPRRARAAASRSTERAVAADAAADPGRADGAVAAAGDAGRRCSG